MTRFFSRFRNEDWMATLIGLALIVLILALPSFVPRFSTSLATPGACGCLGRHVSADAGRFDARSDSLGHSRQAIRRCFRGRIRSGCLGPDGFGLEPRQDIGARVGFLFRPVRSADPQYGRSAPLARTGRAQRILHQDRTGTARHFRAVRRDHESRLFRDRPKRRSGFLGLVLHVLAGSAE